MAHVEFIYSAGGKRMMLERDAKILKQLGKGSYLTRDLTAQAAPVTGPVVNGHGAVPVEPVTPAEPIAAPPEPEQPSLDSDNTPWDPALHVASKMKNGDGTWRKRPGAKSTPE